MKVRGEKAFAYVMPAIDVKYTEIEAGGKAKQEEIKNEESWLRANWHTA